MKFVMVIAVLVTIKVGRPTPVLVIVKARAHTLLSYNLTEMSNIEFYVCDDLDDFM